MRRYVYVVLAAVCFAFIGPLTNLTMGAVHPLTLSFYRVFFGMITLGIIMFRLDPNFLHIKKRDVKHYALVGLIMALAICFYITAFFFAPIANVVLLDYLYPVFIIPIAAFFLKEKATRNEILALIFSLLALFIINPLSPSHMVGNLLAVLSAIAMALLIVYMRFEDRTHSIGAVFWFLLFATIFMAPFPFIFGFGNFLGKIQWILPLGVVSTGLAMLFINLALEKLHAETVAVIDLTLVPLFSIVLGALIVSQIPSLNVVVGGVILVGSALILKRQRPQRVVKK